MKTGRGAFGSVFGVGLVVTVTLVGLFTPGIVGLTKKATARGGTAALAATGAYACFAACAAAVAYGISLIVAEWTRHGSSARSGAHSQAPAMTITAGADLC